MTMTTVVLPCPSTSPVSGGGDDNGGDSSPDQDNASITTTTTLTIPCESAISTLQSQVDFWSATATAAVPGDEGIPHAPFSAYTFPIPWSMVSAAHVTPAQTAAPVSTGVTAQNNEQQPEKGAGAGAGEESQGVGEVFATSTITITLAPVPAKFTFNVSLPLPSVSAPRLNNTMNVGGNKGPVPVPPSNTASLGAGGGQLTLPTQTGMRSGAVRSSGTLAFGSGSVVSSLFNLVLAWGLGSLVLLLLLGF